MMPAKTWFMQQQEAKMDDKANETTQVLHMAAAMTKHRVDTLEQFVAEYPDLAQPAHLRERAWALRTEWLNDYAAMLVAVGARGAR